MNARRRFTILSAGAGWEVIDAETGHPVDTRPTKQEARLGAHELSQAAEAGSRTLDAALIALSNPRSPSGLRRPASAFSGADASG